MLVLADLGQGAEQARALLLEPEFDLAGAGLGGVQDLCRLPRLDPELLGACLGLGDPDHLGEAF